jgi:hypothetical protein
MSELGLIIDKSHMEIILGVPFNSASHWSTWFVPTLKDKSCIVSPVKLYSINKKNMMHFSLEKDRRACSFLSNIVLMAMAGSCLDLLFLYKSPLTSRLRFSYWDEPWRGWNTGWDWLKANWCRAGYRDGSPLEISLGIIFDLLDLRGNEPNPYNWLSLSRHT